MCETRDVMKKQSDPSMKFSFLTGDCNWLDYGGKWVSKKLNNGDFDYWLVIELINMDDACGRDNEGQAKYNVCLSAVSPAEAGDEKMHSAFECIGMEENHELQKNPLAQVEALHSYGISAPLWQDNGNNARKLLREARKQAFMSSTLFGFYMDAPKNRIGSTGWDCIKGDITAGMRR